MFCVFALHDEKEKGKATVLIWEGSDFVGFVAELAKEAFEQIGGASQPMQGRVKAVEFEGAFDTPVEGMNCLGFDRLPFLVEGIELEQSLWMGRSIINGVGILRNLSAPQVFCLRFGQEITVLGLFW